MENAQFSQSFGFYSYSFGTYHYTDNRRGTDRNFIGWMHRGHVVLKTGTHTVEAGPGEVFFIPYGCRYESYWMDDGAAGESVQFESYSFQFYPAGEGRHYTLQKLFPDREAMELLEQIRRDKAVSCRSVGCLYAFLGRLQPAMESIPADSRSATVERAMGYIAAHDSFSAKELARYCSTSPSGLYAAFQQAGMTPLEAKHRLQAERAVKLLTTTDFSVEEISQKLGFSSAAYFRKILRKVTGKTPREIRKTAVF